MVDMDTGAVLDYVLNVQNTTLGPFDIRYLSKIIQNNNYKSILDLGTGQGAFILDLVRELKDIRVLGIDQNPDFLNKAIHAGKDNPNVVFKLGKFDANFPLDKYDLVLSRYCLQHSSAPTEFIKEVYKRLNPGGAFVSIEEDMANANRDKSIWDQFNATWIKCFDLAGADPYIPSKAEPWFKEAGFTNIQKETQRYSPTTMGGDAFKNYLMCLATAMHKIFPQLMSQEFVNGFEKWLDDVIETKRFDPQLPVARVVGWKN